MPLYRPIFKIIWSFGSIFYCSRHIFIYFLSSVSASMLYLLPWVLFPPPRGFIPINFPVYFFIYTPIGGSDFINNWVESIEREDFIKIKKKEF